MYNFRIGDKVITNGERFAGSVLLLRGSKGEVVMTDTGGNVGVSWEIYHHSLHDCRGACEEGTGWFVHRSEIELLSSHSLYEDIIL